MRGLLVIALLSVGCSSTDVGITPVSESVDSGDRSSMYPSDHTGGDPCVPAGWYTFTNELGEKRQVYIPPCSSEIKSPVSDPPNDDPEGAVPTTEEGPLSIPKVRPGPPGDPVPF